MDNMKHIKEIKEIIPCDPTYIHLMDNSDGATSFNIVGCAIVDNTIKNDKGVVIKTYRSVEGMSNNCFSISNDKIELIRLFDNHSVEGLIFHTNRKGSNKV